MLRLTNTEYEIIAENAKAASLLLAEYVRKQITNKKVIVKYEIVADLPELKKLIAELGKIGSNLNQQLVTLILVDSIHRKCVTKSKRALLKFIKLNTNNKTGWRFYHCQCK